MVSIEEEPEVAIHLTKPTVRCIVVTPEETALEARSEFVVLPLYDGEIGVFPKHAPLIGRLGSGELRLKTGEVYERYYIEGGFVQIADDEVAVLTTRVSKEKPEKAPSIDTTAAVH